MLTGPIVAAKNGAPKQLIVFLHGYGDTGDGLIGLSSYFAAALPDAMFISPHAPDPFEMGGVGRQWFSLQGWVPTMPWAAGAQNEVTRHSAMLSDWLDEKLKENNLQPSQLALVGFSQGTMMSLYTALRRPAPIAGVVGFSGALLQPEKLAAEITARPPVLLIHGTVDTVVPFTDMAKTETALKANNVPVQTLARPGLPHSIDEQGIMAAIQFLARQFNQ
jgi:phospholipase/carboxylesterase